jgi:hypothetical protein
MKRSDNIRTEALFRSGDKINGERNADYGDPKKNLTDTAIRWGRKHAWEVALDNIDQKISRMRTSGKFHDDSFIDIIGYAAIAIEVHDGDDT